MTGIECAFTAKLVYDAQPRAAKTGKSWTSLTVVVGEGDSAQWIKVAVFGSAAETIGTLRKGSSLYIEGRLKLDSWTGNDEQLRHGLSVAANVAMPVGQIGRKRQPKAIGTPVGSDDTKRKPLNSAAARDWQRPGDPLNGGDAIPF